MRLIVSADIISFLDSDVVKNIKVEIAESTISSSWEKSNDDTNSTPRLCRMYVLFIESEKKYYLII